MMNTKTIPPLTTRSRIEWWNCKSVMDSFALISAPTISMRRMEEMSPMSRKGVSDILRSVRYINTVLRISMIMMTRSTSFTTLSMFMMLKPLRKVVTAMPIIEPPAAKRMTAIR